MQIPIMIIYILHENKFNSANIELDVLYVVMAVVGGTRGKGEMCQKLSHSVMQRAHYRKYLVRAMYSCPFYYRWVTFPFQTFESWVTAC